MKVEVSQAKAFVIDPKKHYIVTFNSETPIPMAEAVQIKEKLLKVFSNAGAKCDALVTVKGEIIINEVKTDE